MKIYGITGWKNCGKTTLTARLVAHFTAQGLRVSTIKHTHHNVDLERPGTDTHRHREAGAGQVMLASEARWALMTELRAPELTVAELAAKMDPVDLILVEGFKREAHPKIEVNRLATNTTPRASEDTTIRAIATDHAVQVDVPAFDLDDIASIAAFVAQDIDL